MGVDPSWTTRQLRTPPSAASKRAVSRAAGSVATGVVTGAGRGSADERVRLATETEGAMAALEGVARAMGAGERGNEELARMLAPKPGQTLIDIGSGLGGPSRYLA